MRETPCFGRGGLFGIEAMKIVRYQDGEALSAAFANRLREEILRGETGPDGELVDYGIMLSGGSTPLKAYQALAADPVEPAAGCHLFLSDERLVAPDDEANNFHNVRAMFAALGLPETQTPRVRTELGTAEAAAADYAAQMDAFLAKGTIRFGVLGMGGDGHTASLFTPGQFEAAEGKTATGVKRPEYLAGDEGITLTPDVFAGIGTLVFLVGGAGKAEQVANLLNNPASIPAGRVAARCANVELWADEAALANVPPVAS